MFAGTFGNSSAVWIACGMQTAVQKNRPLSIGLVVVTLAILIVSGIGPLERNTWILETAPVMIGLVVALATAKKFPLTAMLCVLLAVHAAILCLGGHYTYAKVPLGDWVSSMFGWERNHYDRLGHIAQGFVPAILTREILMRLSPLRGSRWMFFVVLSVCLAFSAFYEMLEWWAALAFGEGASAFLGTQGDVWDTQWDMFLCGCGAVAAQVLLSVWHRRQVDVIDPPERVGSKSA